MSSSSSSSSRASTGIGDRAGLAQARRSGTNKCCQMERGKGKSSRAGAPLCVEGRGGENRGTQSRPYSGLPKSTVLGWQEQEELGLVAETGT